MTIMTDMDVRLFSLLQGIFALITGLFNYLLFRENTWLHVFFSFSFEGIFAKSVFFGDFIFRYYLPDFLWGYALAEMLYALYPLSGKKRDFLPAAVAFFSGFFYELLQGFGIFPGTGDAVDLLFYLYAVFSAYIGNLFYFKRRQKR